MREPAPDFSSRQYERPNQQWVCGLASEGQVCPAGPTAHGRCPALAECAPVRDGDRWKCNRSALRGGECENGPTPDGDCCRVHQCRPVRSLRAVRGRFVTACTMLAAGLLLIVLSSNWRNRVIAPGPLTRAHAQLMQNGVSQGATDTNCAACHGAAERAVAGWSASLIAGHGEGTSQPALCMECHGKTISTEFALAAHGLPPDVLKVITGKRDVDSSAAKELACAACHREHRGAQFDLTSMNDAACQSCHKHQFESFATDHPDFGAWPYERRTRIVFNHASHRAKHFADKKQSFDCRSCHLDDATGQVQLLASYGVACAACHDDKIATSVSQSVPVLTLPTLDIDAMKAAGQDVGAWPELATGDFDGRLPPMMKLLLAADPTAAKAIASLGVEFEFFDVDPDDPQQLEACVLLAKAMRELLADLARRGPVVARERLAVTLGRDITDAEISGLMAGLPAETARGALRTWFPAEEVDSEAWAKSLVSLGGLDPPYEKGGMLSTRSGVSMQTTNSSMPTPPRGEGMPSLAAGRE